MQRKLVLTTLFFILLSASTVFALRVNRPPTLSYPIKEDQVTQLNKYLYDIWQLQQGRYNFDLTTTPKTNANTGDIWLVQTGLTVRIQLKANGTIYNFTPDGY